MTYLFRTAILLATLAGTTALAKDVGTQLPAFTLEDQTEAEHTLDASVRRIYANAGRDSDKLINEALTELKQAALDAQGAIAVAEISAAPFFVKRIIRSSLKDRPYTTWIDSAGKTRKSIPYRDGRVTVIDLDDRRITAIQFIDDLEALKAELSKDLAKPEPDAASTQPATAE